MRNGTLKAAAESLVQRLFQFSSERKTRQIKLGLPEERGLVNGKHQGIPGLSLKCSGRPDQASHSKVPPDPLKLLTNSLSLTGAREKTTC